MAALIRVSLVFVLNASLNTASTATNVTQSTADPAPLHRVSRGIGKTRFRPSFGPPIQPQLDGTSYPGPAYTDSAYPVYPPYPINKPYQEEATYQVQREQSASYGQDGDVFEHTAGYEAALPGFILDDHQGVRGHTPGFGGAWSGPPPLSPPVILPPPPPPPSQGREFHSVVNYGSISIHHGAHFEPHHNEKEPSRGTKELPGGTGVVEVLPIKSAKPGQEPETITERSQKLTVLADVKEEEAEKTEVEYITPSSAAKI